MSDRLPSIQPVTVTGALPSSRSCRRGNRCHNSFVTPTAVITDIGNGEVQIVMPLLSFLQLVRKTDFNFELLVTTPFQIAPPEASDTVSHKSN